MRTMSWGFIQVQGENFDQILDRSLLNKSHDTFHGEYLKKKNDFRQ